MTDRDLHNDRNDDRNHDDDDDRVLKELLTRPADEVDDIDLVDALASARRATPHDTAPASRAASWLGAAGAAAAIALFVAFSGFGKDDNAFGKGDNATAKDGDDAPRAKGDGAGADDLEGLAVFVVDDSGVPRAAKDGATMRARDGLAFAIVGAPAFDYVLVYGVDDERRVFWFYPEVTGATATSVKAAPGELPDVIHDDSLRPGKLVVHAFFSRSPITNDAASTPTRSGPETSDVAVTLEVLP